eukprot:TRINITY_DN2389_c0_g1_i38.p1 TRINITY_DN2389_c0_g1~~TRINITY_DN2389_c0_g1_i38.p1  ORF type:complete len:296 (+),score=55.82 TRINITY_DN2389_c0_g1_i38:531-1418(+)
MKFLGIHLKAFVSKCGPYLLHFWLIYQKRSYLLLHSYIVQLRSRVVERDCEGVTNVLDEIFEKILEDNLFNELVNIFMPRIISYLGQEVFSMQDIQNLKKTTSFLKRVDVCIHCLNKENYLSWDFLQKVIKMEWNSNGAIFLYRGCENIQNDDPFKISDLTLYHLGPPFSLVCFMTGQQQFIIITKNKKKKKKKKYSALIPLLIIYKWQEYIMSSKNQGTIEKKAYLEAHVEQSINKSKIFLQNSATPALNLVPPAEILECETLLKDVQSRDTTLHPPTSLLLSKSSFYYNLEGY